MPFMWLLEISIQSFMLTRQAHLTTEPPLQPHKYEESKEVLRLITMNNIILPNNFSKKKKTIKVVSIKFAYQLYRKAGNNYQNK